MLQSMTGFASKTISIPYQNGTKTNLACSLKTLNSRFFEATIKLPLILQHLEVEFLKLFKTEFVRGHVFFIIHLSNETITQSTIEPAISIVKRYVSALLKIKQECDIPGQIELTDILKLPNIFHIEQSELDPAIQKVIFDMANELTQQLTIMRTTEGEAITQDITERITIIKKDLNIIAQQVKQEINARTAILATKEAELNTREQEVTQEIENLRHELDKVDIHEEIMRFGTHLNALAKLLTIQKKEKGRRIDFILQELVREINTISSKSTNEKISGLVINVKVELEKMREQAQNVV